jgi:hypothetical protein
MKRLSFLGKVLLLLTVVCAGFIAWDFVQTGALPDPLAAARDFSTSVDQTVHGWLQGLR